MGIEALGSIGSAMGSVPSAVGRGVSSVGQMSAEAGSVAGSIGRIVNEGPMGKSFLENTVPLRIGFDPVEVIRFNEPLSASSVIAEAEAILAQVRKPAIPPSVIPQVRSLIVPVNDNNLYDRTPYCYKLRGHTIHTLVRSYISTLRPATTTESKVSTRPTEAVLIQPVAVYENKKEEIVEERVEKPKQKERLWEGIETEQRVYMEDEQALAQRRHEIKEAVAKARAEADRLGLEKLTGQSVAKFMLAEHAGNRSQVLKQKGPDGSYQETIETIAGIGEFESVEKAIEKSDEIVAEKKPVKVGKNGTPVGNQDVARVFKYWSVKPTQAYTEVTRRVIKKSSAQPGQSLGANTNPPLGWTEWGGQKWTEVGQGGAKQETSLEDLGLAEVFQKAA